MQFLPLLSLLIISKVYAVDTIVTECDPVPTNSVESTPYTTKTQTMFANGKSVVGVIERYQAVEYTSVCGSIKASSSSIPHNTVTIF
ncbi:A-agglutinin-binding subunit [Monosporozyma servazzii]